MLATAGFTLIGLVLVAALYRDPPGSEPRGTRPALWSISRMELAALVPLICGWMAVNVALVTVLSFTPLLLVDRGHTVATAGVVVSWVSFLSIGTLPLGGFVLDRLRRPNWLTAAAAVASAAVCALVVQDVAHAATIAVIAITMAPTLAMLTLTAEVLSPASRSTGLGSDSDP